MSGPFGPLPEPRELGIPLPSWRPAQVYALYEALASDKRFIVVQAPTGTGKGPLAAGFAALTSRRALYVCHTKQLQDQLTAAVPYARVLKGRANYETLDWPFPDVTCADCDKHEWGDCPICRGAEPPDGERPRHCTCCHDVASCPYERAKAEALSSRLCVTNYSYLFSEANHIGRLSGWPLAILDEADMVEKLLMDHISVSFSPHVLKDLGIRHPDLKGATRTAAGQVRKAVEWSTWLSGEVLPAVEQAIDKEKGSAESALRAGHMEDYRHHRRRAASLERLQQSACWMLSDLITQPESWVRTDDESLVFKPVRVAQYADRFLWRHAERWLCMSATIISHVQFCRDLGLDPAQVTYVDVPCMFPAANRPVYYVPAARITHRNVQASLGAGAGARAGAGAGAGTGAGAGAQAKAQAQASAQAPKTAGNGRSTLPPDPLSLRRLVEALDRILARYPASRVLVHTHTYDIARYLLTASKYRTRMVSYGRPEADPLGREHALDLYRRRPDAVLIAPSMERGVDLPGDLCRVQVICKVPYPSLGDRQVNARFHSGVDGKAWYYTQTARALVQMTGRAVRAEDDWAHTYILDMEFVTFYRTHRPLFPAWWREAVVMDAAKIVGGDFASAAGDRNSHSRGEQHAGR